MLEGRLISRLQWPMPQVAMDTDELLYQPKLRALYTQAIEGQWNAGDVLNWKALSFDHVGPAVRGAMATVYRDIAYAEAFGMAAVERLVRLAPAGWQRDFAEVQLKDEIRHTHFFERVVALLGHGERVSEELEDLRLVLECIDDYDELLLHTQVMETAARVVFVGNGQRTLELLGRGIRLPGSASVAALLKVIVDLVGRDESRHIALGTHCLRMRLGSLDLAARHAMERRAVDTSRLMHGAFARRSAEFRSLGIDPQDVLERTWSALTSQMGRLELDIGMPSAVSRD